MRSTPARPQGARRPAPPPAATTRRCCAPANYAVGVAARARRHVLKVGRPEFARGRPALTVGSGEETRNVPGGGMSRRSWLLFAAMCVIWGVPYLMIRVAVREVSPGTLVFARTALGALLLVPLAIRRDALRPVLRRWRPLLAYTAVEVAVPWLMLSDAETELSSSLTGLLIAAVPLVGVGIARLQGTDDPVDGYRAIGLLLGIGGVVALLGLASICTAVAFVVFFALIAAIGPARATVITYVNPAVAVLLGVTMLGERFTAGMALGFPLILAGSVLAARKRT